MIAKKEFGRTGHMSTRTLFGAAALGGVDQKTADETLEVLFEYGVNHIDTAASYGAAEDRIQPWLQKYRDQFFLATKSEKRTYKEAWQQLENSRRRMGVDVIDLWQMHSLSDPEEWKTAFGPDGAIKAFLEAREKGYVRFLGVTGHGMNIPTMHMKSLEQHSFDSILLPWNYLLYQDDAYRTAWENLVSYATEKGIAVQTIKSLMRRPWGDQAHFADCWYEPHTQEGVVQKAVSWVLGDDRLFLNTTGDVKVLPGVLEAASKHTTRPSDAEMAAMVQDTEMANIFANM
ncbi:MAG: aldo/keto reductase [Anaerolineae bacterium]|jgi:aryl-alcohol dehydrogenase-like predicted oxidoreductase|nr:aldo/keto reductase [Anaerolineae bacterium]